MSTMLVENIEGVEICVLLIFISAFKFQDWFKRRKLEIHRVRYDPKMVVDCHDIKQTSKTSCDGIYTVDLNATGEREVLCDMTTDGGGWTVFQKRHDGSVNFTRNFSEYENGFGQLTAEFWLGLSTVYKMMEGKISELRIDMTAANGTTAYTVFGNFSLGPAPNYILHIGQGIGNAGERSNCGLHYHNGSPFSTYDRDMYTNKRCTGPYRGGWWYYSCYQININGEYLTPGALSKSNAMRSLCFDGGRSLLATRMMFRKNS